MYALQYLDLILKDDTRNSTPFYLFQAYSSLFDCCYGKGTIEAALQYGLLAETHADKMSTKNIAIHYMLLGVSFCYIQLKD